jgi:hypothetical protein
MSHIVLGGHWCDNDDDDDVRNSLAPTDVNINTKGGYHIIKYISCWSLPCHMRNPVEDINLSSKRRYIKSNNGQLFDT